MIITAISPAINRIRFRFFLSSVPFLSSNLFIRSFLSSALVLPMIKSYTASPSTDWQLCLVFHYMDLWRDCQTERHYAHMKSGARKRTPLWCYLFIIFSFLLVEDSACNGKGCDYKNCCISTDRGVIAGLDSDYPLAVTFVYLSCCSTGSCCGCIA